MVPCGTPSWTAISGAGLCVGPMMKFPSASAGAFVPSGNSFAVTYPGVCGSRVGGVGRAGGGGGGVCAEPVIKKIKKTLLRRRNIGTSFRAGPHDSISTDTPGQALGLSYLAANERAIEAMAVPACEIH